MAAGWQGAPSSPPVDRARSEMADRVRAVLDESTDGTWAIAVTVEFLRDILAELEG